MSSATTKSFSSLFGEMKAAVQIVLPAPDASLRESDKLSYSDLCCITDMEKSDASFQTNASSNAGLSSPKTGGAASNGDNEAAPSSPLGNKDQEQSTTHRDRRNGAFTFQENTEYDLLLHVQKGLTNIKLSDVESANNILKSVDEYCLGQQWMFHVGYEKGMIISDFLCKAIKEQQQPSGNRRRFVIADLGTYCGYSAILLAKTVRDFAPDVDFHVYSTEIQPKYIQVAKNMIQMAKLDKYITVIEFDPKKEGLAALLKKHILPSTGLDFLFMDHAKNLYLRDLQELEATGFIRKGTHVAADNVVFNRLDQYRDHCKALQTRKIVVTRLEKMNLEYTDSSQNVEDGIEFTAYVQDPPK